VSVRGVEPGEVARRLAAGEELVLLDVREPEEVELCSIAGSLCIPLGELASRLDELDPERPTVCVCHHGIRSAGAAGLLEMRAVREVMNLVGGIDRWAAELDARMPRY
jgi:rhodanese-related sulfurtransferase